MRLLPVILSIIVAGSHGSLTAQSHVVPAAPQLIAISVVNLDASARWYGDVFGLAVRDDMSPAATTRVRILSGGRLTVELIEDTRAKPAGDPAGEKPLVHGFFKIAIPVFNLDSAVAIFRAKGIPLIGHWPTSAPPNAMVADNAGNLIQLFQVER